ncbi:hypothetical protein ACU4GI_11010 [Cupriavidus basilensis]
MEPETVNTALKYGIPVAALFVLAVIFLVLFRRQIAGKIEGITDASKSGIKFGPSLNQDQPAEPIEQKTPSSVQDVTEFMAKTHTPTILLHEEAVKKDLEKWALGSAAEREKILTRALASTQVTSSFDRTLSVMWRSQFQVLQLLNGHHDGVQVDNVRTYYDAAKEAFPRHYENYDFESWAKFLVNNELAEGKADKAFITPRGRDFLLFVTATGRPVPTIA